LDRQMMFSVITLVILFEAFLIALFIMYKRGKIVENPFVLLIKKELNILFHVLFRWRVKETANTFSLQKNSNYFWLFLALVHEQIIEMIVFHIYLKKEEPELALIMLILHIYSVLYMLGDYNLLRNSPVRFIQNKVFLHIGARRSLDFQISDIEYIQPAEIKYNKSGGIIHEKRVFHATAFPRILTIIFGISDDLKYEIVFKRPIYAKGYFGQKKEIHKALIYIDKAEEFIKTLEEKREASINICHNKATN
jgi:hypothetical protein